MQHDFFLHPVVNSPYGYPARHWALDEHGQPTGTLVESRRAAEFITPVPKPKKTKATAAQPSLIYTDTEGLSTEEQEYNHSRLINEVRSAVDAWRQLPNPNQWGVTPETARLLRHWRHHNFSGIKPFFCQIEAVETAIWLTEVAPKLGNRGVRFITHLKQANEGANPGLFRLALKLATGAGKTTVMALLIAWQTVNAVRHPGSKLFSSGFLIVAPGITIKDRLRVLLPNDPDSYYRSREIVPLDMMPDVMKARIVITNYHAFKLRERLDIAKGTRTVLEGWREETVQTLETEGQMLQRVMPELMGLKRVVVLNDEAHHCYREKPTTDEEGALKGDDKAEADENNKAARLWLSGLEIVQRKLGITTIFDLSATPFFLRGSGYAEGTLFPWTMSDFSLMDAIECGIVKLPRVPISDNVPGSRMPLLRNLWDNIGKDMPKKGRGSSAVADPEKLPHLLYDALDALYGHYRQVFELWEQQGIDVPPVFIVVCNNTTTSELVYKYISGWSEVNEDGNETVVNTGHFPLFANYDENHQRHSRPRTILIDSAQLESGDALDPSFRAAASDEIERFRRDIAERVGNPQATAKIDDATLLREVMNTVGKSGKLGAQIRCVVSVSMLTEGWDANTVTHILGVRAFGTQLLCEQVVGRALRRQSYELNAEGLLNPEYADILGIPFDFTAKPVVSVPATPKPTTHVHAVRPDRDALEIVFPRVAAYRTELPDKKVTAQFTSDSTLELTPDLVGPTNTENAGIIGESNNLTLADMKDARASTIIFKLATYLITRTYRDAGEDPPLHFFGPIRRIVREWMDNHLVCKSGTYPALLLRPDIAERAAEKIKNAITYANIGEKPVIVVPDPFAPIGSSADVSFVTTKTTWKTDPKKSHINVVVCDSDWEAEFCRVVEKNPHVLAYVKNQGLGFEVPYNDGHVSRHYRPDFIVRIDDGEVEPVSLVVEIKGYRKEDAKAKAETMRTLWIPGVNHLETCGRWAFEEFKDVFEIEDKFNELVDRLRAAPKTTKTTEAA
ncbi:BPTD_3080 family restriction endonuclease [Komagataeibacter xylinus]|uniref:BPTD_3080 family restriction endonuclease n=1 Tax=Komagataeibacter xylinus TaxID=28448 RepID=UPI0013EC3252|nr:DEAD/DEAH box helicase family protein [Komagataeibacter xylinus]